MAKTYYFGWCTWMNPEELHRYWPEARIITKGYVDNWRVEWCSASGRTDRGWCHLDNTPKSWGNRCLGIIVEAPEGCYSEEYDYDDFVRISLTVHGDDGKTYDCWTYTLSRPNIPMRPPYFYWDHMVAGLNAQGFPQEYCEKIVKMYNDAAECPRADRPNPSAIPGKGAESR